jgi:hypothetical protein
LVAAFKVFLKDGDNDADFVLKVMAACVEGVWQHVFGPKTY